MLKKLFLLAASCVLLYSCIGCSGNQSKIGNVNQVSSENKTVGEDEIPTVVWQIYDESQGLGGRFTDIWQASLDRLLVEKGAPYKVKIEVYYESIEDAERFSPAQLLENIKSENQQADVIAIPSTMIGWDENGNLLYDYYSYQEMIRQELLEPLDDMLKTEKGAKIREALTRMELKRSQVNGVTYGISQHMRIFNAVAYRKDLLEKYGIKQEELSDDIFENDDILKVVRDGEEEKVVPYVTDMGDLRRLGIWIIDECEMLACNQEGTFVNVFESDELKKYLNQKKGLLEQRLTNIHNQSSGDFFAIASYAETDQIYETVYKVYDPGKGEQELDVVVIPNKASVRHIPLRFGSVWDMLYRRNVQRLTGKEVLGSNMKESILIVDDEREIADLMEVYLNNDGYTVYKFYSGAEALECIESKKIDLAVLDVMLPDIDGFQICRKIREKFFFPIIMLTAKVEDSDKIMGLTIGADDYITKPFNPLEVVARVKTQLRRYMRYNSNSEQQKESVSEYDIKGLLINRETHSCRLFEEEISLTPIEFSVLWYLCENRGKVVSSEELFEAVWKEKYLDNNNTVMAHIGRLREKLHEPAKKPRFIKTVWGVGYKIEA